MARTQARQFARRRPALATLRLFPLALLAVVVGVSFGGTGREAEPPLAARVEAEQVTAFRVALNLPLFDAPADAPAGAAPEAAPQPQPLLAPGETIVTTRHATRVRIASVGIDVDVSPVGYVFQDGQLRYDVPRRGAGQYSGTAAPGELGNTVIAGHVASRSGPAVFRDLAQVRVGDTVEVFRGDQLFVYVVTELRIVPADETSVMRPSDDATVTLITCSREQNFKDRFVVVGKLV